VTTRLAPRHNTLVPSRTSSPPQWLLLVHQLPSTPSNLRVRTWRRLQQLGALPVKQALYVLPDSASAREDFEWLKTEIEGAGGQASVFSASAVDTWSNEALIEEFRRAREASYGALAEEAERLLKRQSWRPGATASPRALRQLKERLVAVERVDFFGGAGRDRVATLVERLEDLGRPPRGRQGAGQESEPPAYRNRLWVTRPRPGIDRVACAWLIRRFIDRDARFAFVADRDSAPADAVTFDMFGGEFTHRGDSCTFETLCDVFHLSDPVLPSLAAIVHDLDLKDGRFGAPEAATVGSIIDGLRLTHAADNDLLSAGIALFEALYRAFAETRRLEGLRPIARQRNKRSITGKGRRRP
jgi:hypothetical protein